MSHVLEELLGKFDCVQGSLLLIYVGLEQGPNSSYIAHPRHARQARYPTYSTRNANFLIPLLLALDDRSAMKLTIGERAVVF
jgi:hypothetical protein